MSTPDKLIIKEQKLIPQALHRLKMAAKKAWFEFNVSEGADWGDSRQEKWHIYYDHGSREFTVIPSYFIQRSILPCFPTKESCRAYIDDNPEDLELLFGVE